MFCGLSRVSGACAVERHVTAEFLGMFFFFFQSYEHHIEMQFTPSVLNKKTRFLSYFGVLALYLAYLNNRTALN